jgi:hypothetical protein
MTSGLSSFSNVEWLLRPLNQFKIVRRRSKVAAQETIHE